MLHSHDKCYLERIEQRTLEIKHNKDILTKREFELATLFTNGDRTAAVAAKLGISPNTVKNHLKNIFKKLEVKNKKELAYKLLNLTQVQ